MANSEIEVEHPSHYNAVEGMPELWEILDAFFPDDPHKWQAGKYLFRAGKKDGTPEEKDLEKSGQMMERRRQKLTAYAIGDVKLTSQDNPETLGDIAEILRKWKEESRITRESILYVLGKVY